MSLLFAFDALPIISLFDLALSLVLFESPSYWPISITAFTLSGIAVWYGSSCKSEGPVLPKANLIVMLVFLLYLSHWFLFILHLTF